MRSKHYLYYFENRIYAGFPSPAMDYTENNLDLNEYLIRHPSSTFFIRVIGNSMKDEGIHDGDLLIVDKSLHPDLGQIVIAEINGEYTVKKIGLINGNLHLIAANPDFVPIPINEGTELVIWGVVLFSIHKV